MPAPLDELIDAYIQDLVHDRPVLATSLGIDGHEALDGELGDFSETAFVRRDAHAAEWVRRFGEVGTGPGAPALTLDEELDRDLVISTETGKLVMQDWAVWRRDPATYLSPVLAGTFALFLHRLRPDAELAAAAASRLRQVPSILDHARRNLDPEIVAPVFAERGIGQARAGASYARTLVPAEVGESDGRADLAAAGAEAADALEAFAGYLEELQGRAQGSYAIGESRYSALLERKEHLAYGAVEMRERGHAAWAELDAEMSDLAARIDPGAAGWRGVVEALNREHADTPEEMWAAYERETERARRFLIETGLVTMPAGEECRVVPSPPFQRPILAVASYNAPPAFRPSATGYFFVPFPPDGASDAEVQQRLATNAAASIPTISVHEAYPGHHWHLVWMQGNPRPIRKVLWTSYFVEGWGLYAEKLMREQGFFTDPRHELAHLDARIFRAARIVVDTSLHIGDMTFDEAVAFMTTRASLSEGTARAEVGRYCSWPTQASSYLTGSLEIERIRSRYLAAGRGDLRTFHDTIAGAGGLPLGLAERAALEG